MKLDSVYWSNRAVEAGKPEHLGYSCIYGNRVLKRVLDKACKNPQVILKTDLWNEGVSVSRAVLERMVYSSCMFGIDISKATCKQAKALMNRSVGVAQADIRSLPFKDACFDLIIDNSTLDHISTVDAVKVIEDYQRLLMVGGVLVLVYAQDQPFQKLYQMGLVEGVFFLDSCQIKKAMQKNFNVVEDRLLNLLPYLFVLPPRAWFCPIMRRSPQWFQQLVMAFTMGLETSPLIFPMRSYAGFRVMLGRKMMCVKLNSVDCPLICSFYFCCMECSRSCTGKSHCSHYSPIKEGGK